ncbi:hypothetical protein RCL1_002074 [Eukaryota sp. TZLM3-RCL]
MTLSRRSFLPQPETKRQRAVVDSDSSETDTDSSSETCSSSSSASPSPDFSVLAQTNSTPEDQILRDVRSFQSYDILLDYLLIEIPILSKAPFFSVFQQQYHLLPSFYLDALISACLSSKICIYNLIPQPSSSEFELFLSYKLLFHVSSPVVVAVLKFWKKEINHVAYLLSLKHSLQEVVGLLRGFFDLDVISKLISPFAAGKENWAAKTLEIFASVLKYSGTFEITSSRLHSSFSTKLVSKISPTLRVQSRFSCCRSCKLGKHCNDNNRKCFFKRHLESSEGIYDRSYPDSEQFLGLCLDCSFHSKHIIHLPQDLRATDIRLLDPTRPCLDLNTCRSCLLLGHRTHECIVCNFTGTRAISLIPYNELRLYFPSTVIHEHFKEKANPKLSFQECHLFQRVIALAQNETSPLVALIARVLRFYNHTEWFNPLFDKTQTEFTPSRPSVSSCFYVEAPVRDNLWRTYYYIPPFLRTTFALLHYTAKQEGPFFYYYSNQDSNSQYREHVLLKEVIDCLLVRLNQIYTNMHPVESLYTP